MSSAALQSSVSSIQQNHYLTFVLLTAVGYDYILVLPNEIEFIWSKSWTWISIMYILVRYCGLYTLVSDALREIMDDVERWAYLVFLGAADYVMILRVWAMYGRSRTILGILLTVFSIEVVSVVAYAVVYENPKNEQYRVLQVLEYSFCSRHSTLPIFGEMSSIGQMIFGAVLCMFAIFQFIKQSLQMYRLTKRWQLNQYINLLVQQGTVYFFAIFLLNLVALLSTLKKITGTWQVTLAYIVEYVPVYTLTPRFIIGTREMYARDVRGGRGAWSVSAVSSRGGAAREPMVFAAGVESVGDNVEMDAMQNETRGDIEEVPREVA